DTLSGTVLTLGDNAYPNGTLGDYQNCYDPTWGRHKARTYATLGNRDYNTGAADGAFDYFGNHAGPRAKGYYSFDLGAWHILVLNAQQHLYERFTPMTPDGAVDSVGGIREINVGTGGESTALPTVSAAHSEVVSAAYGVLKLTLSPDRYSWQFVPIAGQAFSD